MVVPHFISSSLLWNFLYVHKFISGISILFHWPVFLFFTSVEIDTCASILHSNRISHLLFPYSFKKRNGLDKEEITNISQYLMEKCIHLVPFLSVLLLHHVFVFRKLEDIPQSQALGVSVHWVLPNASGCNTKYVHGWKPIDDFKLACSWENKWATHK